jgi:hypothetical protein
VSRASLVMHRPIRRIVPTARSATALAGVPRPPQSVFPEPRFDALAQALFQEAEHVVDAERLDGRLVRAGYD